MAARERAINEKYLDDLEMGESSIVESCQEVTLRWRWLGSSRLEAMGRDLVKFLEMDLG